MELKELLTDVAMCFTIADYSFKIAKWLVKKIRRSIQADTPKNLKKKQRRKRKR